MQRSARKNLLLLALLAAYHISLFAQLPAFPGAEGFGASATGGRGGQVIYVTNLNCNGTGSLNAALQVPGPKYILFKVSGQIPCAAEVVEGNCYIAGQTSPGGIIVRGVIADGYYDPNGHPDNLVIRHLRSRGIGGGETGNYITDPMILSDVHNAIIDHCSLALSDDEAVDISRSSELTVQNCLLAETVGEHAYLGGMLINYSSPGQVLDNLSIHHNTWNRLGGRMPEFSCEDPSGCIGHTVHVECSDNLFWDQQIQLWYNADADLSTNDVEAFYLQANFVNNSGVARSSNGNPMFSFDFLNVAQNQLFVSGNKLNQYPDYSDYQLFYCCNDFSENSNHPNTEPGIAQHRTARHPFPNITYTPTANVRNYMVENVGAFPRDPMDRRLMQPVANNVIAAPPVDVPAANDGLLFDFDPANPPAPPTDTDNDGMPDYWEIANNLNPNQADHNGTQLSLALTGVAGYTNLECYLNCLAEARVSGGAATCGIVTATSAVETNPAISVNISPQPLHSSAQVMIRNLPSEKTATFQIRDLQGRIVVEYSVVSDRFEINRGNLPSGLYVWQLLDTQGRSLALGKIAVE